MNEFQRDTALLAYQKPAEALADRLLKKLQVKSRKVQEKYDYYNAENAQSDLGIALRGKLRNLQVGVGWATRAVDTVSDRINFDAFSSDEFSINRLFDMSNAREIINRAKHDAHIAGCAFIALSKDGEKISLVPFTALEATGEIDYATGMLKNGLAVQRWENKQEKASIIQTPADYVVFTPEYTAFFKNKILCDIKKNFTKRPLIHLIARRQSANSPFGKSRITKTARRIIQEATRLKKRYEIAAEFYSTPFRYLNGLSEGAESSAGMDSAISKILQITKDEDGDKPEIGQLPQMSMTQFSEQKKDLARDFCAETGLTLRNLGFETGNPTSAESLVAMSDDLILQATATKNEMGEQIRQLAFTMRLLADNNDIIPENLLKIRPVFMPITQIDLAQTGDAVYKLIEAMPELKGTVQAYRLLGFDIQTAESLQAKAQSMSAQFKGEA